MKASLLLLSVATLALANPRPQFPTAKTAKAGKTISKTIKMVGTAVNGLDTAVKAVMGPMGANALGDVAAKGSGLGDVISKAQSTIGAQDQTDLIGALDIADAADGLTKNLNTLSDDLIKIEPTVRMAGLSGAVVGILQQQQGSAGGLVKTVVSKLPDEAKDLAKDQTKDATKGLDRVLAAYQAGMAKGAAPKRMVRRRAALQRRRL